MADCGCDLEATNDEQRRTLRIVLAINAVMFVAEITAGLLAESTGLIADSLDMLADASVYAISLFAVGQSSNCSEGRSDDKWHSVNNTWWRCLGRSDSPV